MPVLPKAVRREYVSSLPLILRGKVRDTYALPDTSTLLPVATDRVSIFDFVLPAEVPQKGEVLAAVNTFWSRRLFHAGFSQDVIQSGFYLDQYLPPALQGNSTIWKRGAVVTKLKMIPVEAIVRGYLTGSGWGAYTNTAPHHLVCGHTLPPGLKDGDCLPTPIFTPTTKAEEGHDEHIDAGDVRDRFTIRLEELALELFLVASKIALDRGIILADTKLEFGHDPALAANAPIEMRRLILADERFTPDSSHFWLREDWMNSRANGTSPTSFDKQYVREWGKTVGIHRCNPLIPKDVEYVHNLEVPESVLLATRQLYRYIFYRLTGKRLELFQREDMGIPTSLPPVEVIVDNGSDLGQIEKGLGQLRAWDVSVRVHIISFHQSPETLRSYAKGHIPTATIPPNATIIVAAAGQAAALPGILQAWLRCFGKGHIPVIGVALRGKSEAEEVTAKFSIEQIPGNPVILDEDQKAYFGSDGFHAACVDAATKEFFVPPAQIKEPHQFNLPTKTTEPIGAWEHI
jgi:phosphoribosylaminoimidazole-succinocarboxamide synthase